MTFRLKIKLLVASALLFVAANTAVSHLSAQENKVVYTADEQLIADQIHALRSLPDDVRARTTKDLALKIRTLPATAGKLRLAVGLGALSTEGDSGHDALQEVATTLANTLRERPVPWADPKDSDANVKAGAAREPAYPYMELATLVRYEHVNASLEDEQFRSAMVRLEGNDKKREHLDFTLKDLSGKTWTFSELRGKVVLVNFWATWCPPCRKEMPDLDAIYTHFQSQGLVVLSLTDEDPFKVNSFLSGGGYHPPVLLDSGGKVAKQFHVDGIPKTFVFDREGKLVAQSIDMRTQHQFLLMLAKAGLHP
jgi:peroxiredoxin